ncbi:MAG: MOSC domain-containing protein, partial [Gammaproteobacteria bacterium]|nr:MOSC domain-containing protein [Gammaproteobacteria bacterium]
MKHQTRDELDAGLAHIQASPSDGGRLEMLVRRPRTDAREELEAGRLDLEAGLEGDKWRNSGHGRDSAEHL